MNTQILAAISGDQLIQAVIWLVIAATIFWLVNWFVAWVGVPEPFNKIIKVILGIVVLLICINVLLSLTGHPIIAW